MKYKNKSTDRKSIMGKEGLCKHLEYCYVTKDTFKRCDENRDCELKRFYNKYGENYNTLGIGS